MWGRHHELRGGQKGKGSDKGGYEKERKGMGKGKGKLHGTVTVCTNCLTRLSLLTPSTAPFPFSAVSPFLPVHSRHMMMRPRKSQILFFPVHHRSLRSIPSCHFSSDERFKHLDPE